MYFTFDPGLTVTVNFIFTLREPNVYKPHGFFLGFLATFICFCVTVLFYRYLYFVVNQIKLQSKVTKHASTRLKYQMTDRLNQRQMGMFSLSFDYVIKEIVNVASQFSSVQFYLAKINYNTRRHTLYKNCKLARKPRRNQKAYEAWAPQSKKK